MNSDIIIIGAGPGGYETAAEAARKGLKTILIERDELGGTCLNRGCIPTKTYCHAAHVIEHAAEMSAYGVNFAEPTVDYPTLVAKKDEVVATLRDGIEQTLAGVEIIRGEARLTPQGKVSVNGEELSAEKIIIATGSAPATLPIPGAELAVNSDYLLSMTALPASMAIIGGGVIGMEFASVYNALGVEVTVIEYCKEILPPFDRDIAKRLRTMLAGKGIKFYVGAEVTAISDMEGTSRKVEFTAKGKTQSIAADMVVMAVGRRAVLPEGTESAGINVGRRGIEVDPASFSTSVPGIYAIGDVNGLCMLAHVATAQGKRVLGEEVNLDVVPSAVFTSPEAAIVGLTEQQCSDQGIEVRIGKTLYGVNGRAVAIGANRGMVKILVDKATDRLIGCHVLGPDAAAIVQEAALAMANKLTVDDIMLTIHNHPTLAELLPIALSKV